MKNFEEKLKNVSQRVVMSDRERTALKSRILNEISGVKSDLIASPYASLWLFVRRHSISVVFVAVLFFSGSLSSLAEGSLPGDILYPLKVGVNEEVRGWFAKSGNAKSEWQISLAERRLDEVEKLQEHGSLEGESILEIEEKIEKHARIAEETIDVGISGLEAVEDRSVPAETTSIMMMSVSDEIPVATTSIQDNTLTVSSSVRMEKALPEKSYSREDLKNLKTKAEVLKDRLERLQDRQVFEERSKVRLILVRARENLFKADIALTEGREEYSKELLKKAEENILRAEKIVNEYESNVIGDSSKEDVKGANTEIGQRDKATEEDVRLDKDESLIKEADTRE